MASNGASRKATAKAARAKPSGKGSSIAGEASAPDVASVTASGFMHKYYDWAAFEEFVKALHENDGDVVVERDVTESDRYGAKRQIDVKITRKTRFRNFVTIVECKRWKDPVSRDRIDVLASSIEALGAANGAMFTTRGFEEGAVAYAKGKGIELFLVRDLTPEEWGSPGRHVSMTLHHNVGEFVGVRFQAKAIPLVDEPPKEAALGIDLGAKGPGHPDFDLFSVKSGERGPNLVDILGDAHGMLLAAVGKSFGVFDGGAKAVLELVTPCDIDLTETEFCQLRLPKFAARIERIGAVFKVHVNQDRIEVDRGAKLDFAVMVESVVSDQRLVAHRQAGENEISFRDGTVPKLTPEQQADLLPNDSLLTVAFARWVGVGAAVADKSMSADGLIRVKVHVVNGKPSLSLAKLPLSARPQ